MIQLFKKANDKAGAEVDPKDPTKQKWNADTVYVQIENEMVPLAELAKHAKENANEYEAIQSVENELEINGAVHNVSDLIESYKASKKNEESKDTKKKDPEEKSEDQRKKDEEGKGNKKNEDEDKDKDMKKDKKNVVAGAQEDNEDENAKAAAAAKKNEDKDKDKDKENKDEEDDVEEKIKKNEKEEKKDVRHYVRLNSARENGTVAGVLTIDTMTNRIDRGKSRYGTN